MEVVLGDQTRRHDVYRQLLEVNNFDMGLDWFQRIYESEMSEGKRKGQHFTPPEIYRLVSELANLDTGSAYEPTAGTGGMVIGDWWRRSSNVLPWEWRPWNNAYEVWELSDRALPLLLINLSIRGIHALVYHGDVLEKTVFAKYFINNKENDPLGFSEIEKIDDLQ